MKDEHIHKTDEQRREEQAMEVQKNETEHSDEVAAAVYMGGAFITRFILFLLIWLLFALEGGFWGALLGWIPAGILSFMLSWLWPLAALGVLLAIFFGIIDAIFPESEPVSTRNVSPVSVTRTPPLITQESGIPRAFENDYMLFLYPQSWIATPAFTNAVNLRKGSFILYINPVIKESSGFDAYAAGAPGVELVMGGVARPRGIRTCADVYSSQVTSALQRASLVTKTMNADPSCNVPFAAAWFFSFYTTSNTSGFGDPSLVTPGYLNPHPVGAQRRFVITATYDASSPESLPTVQNMSATFSEMDSIVRSIQFK